MFSNLTLVSKASKKVYSKIKKSGVQDAIFYLNFSMIYEVKITRKEYFSVPECVSVLFSIECLGTQAFMEF